jgi:Biotin-lipoyl like
VSHVTATHEDGKVEGRAKSVATNLTALQCELRALFANRPTNRALAEALDRIGTKLEATYAVVHTRLGVHLLSEEWSRGGVEADAQVREQVNTALWESVSTEEARSTRLPGEGDRQVVVTGVLYDQDAQPSGGAALVLRDCDRTRVLQTMAQLEGVLGYLSLLLGDGKSSNRRPAERHAIEPSAAADHPVRLAFSMIGELESRYGFEMTAIGFVRADHGVAVVYSGGGAHTEQEDCRLHAQWSATVQGNTVASFPLVFMDQIVAIVSMSQGAGTPLSREQVALIAEELSGYAALVPLSQAATRSLGAHAVASTRRWLTQIVGRGRRKTAIIALLVSLLGGWIGFGQLRHTFTVPCVVKAADRRTIACPRSGVLAEVFVRPGDRVHSGQLLAAIDANEDFLARAGITAEIESLEALIDQAVAKRESGQIRVHEARKRSLQAQLMIVDASIAEAQIRAPQDGLILEGDLRERLGGRIELGTPMFVLARYDRAAVVLRIPEQLVLAAQEARGATFAPSANPDQTYDLAELLIAPASTVVEERNVFLGEATMTVDLGLLPPGMEGTAYVDAGPRSVFWVLTHKLTDWLRLNFWI